jgi:DNA-binding Lrp family transcriptional regulator
MDHLIAPKTAEPNPDNALISLLQSGFPLMARPFDNIGSQMGISAAEVISRIEILKQNGKVRQIGAVIDGRLLGYQSTLLALQIPPERLPSAETVIKKHPGISHAYERENPFNVWVTLVVPPGMEIEAEATGLASSTGAISYVSLPAIKIFKLRVQFGPDEDDLSARNAPGVNPPAEMDLSGYDRMVIHALQQDLPLVTEPFEELANQIGMGEDDFLARAQSLSHGGVVRRYGASIDHRHVGFTSNAMACWRVLSGKVDAAGAELSAKTRVSHCYERRTGPLWRHNLFAMIHGATVEDCMAIVNGASTANELNDRMVLVSTREIKKTRVRYEAKH